MPGPRMMRFVDIDRAVAADEVERAVPAAGRADDPAIVALCEEINRLIGAEVPVRVAA